MKKLIVLFGLFLFVNPILSQTKTAVIDESFSSFLKKFTSDKSFHLSRINFPLTVKLNNDDFELINYIIVKNDYVPIQLNDKGSSYQHQNNPKNNTYIIKRRGVDNGIFVDYIFTKRKGLWYLKTWIDEST
ncbi:hypothetical protein HNP37_003904 [Flavobacterium nitrogenifigens]|uniref:DUF4348 domain-containing protein n=2 Tax=Flavobacterium TaxID=237 RepID=A0A7W7N9U1_9FLAO|nr:MULTISPECIES: DUF4348 domain-containing protein [Flavobacterium]MBB4803824.1 hypothetical protein [Flavobacterium nitrogenifigens]MBB6389024.1 hypothetical protein [Flavobacterium notoginsengisoli]